MAYKCTSCGTESDEQKECCGGNMEVKCDGCGNVQNACSCGD